MPRQRHPSLRLERLETRDLPAIAPGLGFPAALLHHAAPSHVRALQKNNLAVKYEENGAPVGAGAAVNVYDQSGKLIRSFTTDADGKLMFDALPVASYRITASFTKDGRHYSGHFDFAKRFSRTLWVQEVVTPPPTKPVGGFNSIGVTVRDEANQQTIAGARVRLTDGGGHVLEEYLSNAKGQVEFWDLGEQPYAIAAYDAATRKWVAPKKGGNIDFSTQGSRRWTPTVNLGTAAGKALHVTGGKNQFLYGNRGGVATGLDYTHSGGPGNETVSSLSLTSYPGIAIAAAQSDARLLSALRAGLAPGGSLASKEATLFADWNADVSLPTTVTKASTTLLPDKDGHRIPTHVLRHDADSELAASLMRDQKFLDYWRPIAKQIQQAIASQAATGTIRLDNLTVSGKPVPPSYSPPRSVPGILTWLAGRDPKDLARIIGGFQGSAIFLVNFKLDTPPGPVAANAKIHYSADLFFLLDDDFGVDHDDLKLADLGAGVFPEGARGLRAQWVLQHERGARPFVNEIQVRVPITGSFKVPYGYDRLIDQSK